MELDKQMHRDELKLRILVTDKCNLDCSFCLNDFQRKVHETFSFIEEKTVFSAIEAYSNFFEGKYPLQVYFSGGEPTLHKNLVSFLEFAKDNKCRTTLVSNGYFKRELEDKLTKVVDCMHISAYKKDERLRNKAVRMSADIQSVYSSLDPYVDMEFLGFYISAGLKVKIFPDFFDKDYADYQNFLNKSEKVFPKGSLSGRYTGHQENRGLGCFGCDRKCITLKAAWVYSNGSTSPCVQHLFTKKPESMEDWINSFKSAENFHKV
jgi:organic radical activating enzyme